MSTTLNHVAPTATRFVHGEVMQAGDINSMQETFARRMVADAEIDPALALPQLRPVGPALSPLADVTTFRLVLKPGLIRWCAADILQPSAILEHRLDRLLAIDVDGRPPAGTRRFDILSARVDVDTDQSDLITRIVATDVDGRLVYTPQTIDRTMRTRLTITYTPGTPAPEAEVPEDPQPPSGEQVFARIRVRSSVGFTPGLNNMEDIDDLRTPDGMHTRIFGLGDAAGDPGWSYVHSNSKPRWQGGAEEPVLTVPLFMPGPHRRFSKLFVKQSSTRPTAAIKAINFENVSVGELPRYDITEALDRRSVEVMQHIDRPIWSNGFPSPLTHENAAPIFEDFADYYFTAAALELTANSSSHSLIAVAAVIWGQ